MDSVEDRILNAAMKVFSKEGYSGATTRKIADEANVNEVTLFRKFHSKENILKVVLAKNRENAHQKLDSILLMKKNANITTRLSILGQDLMQFMDERMDFIIMLITEGRTRPEIAETRSSIPKMILDHLEEYFNEQMSCGKLRKIDPQAAAFTYLSFIFYNSLNATSDPILINDRMKAFENFIDVFTNGITNIGHRELKQTHLKKEYLKKARMEAHDVR
jgi:TetR/AcrR family transcriptional regulator